MSKVVICVCVSVTLLDHVESCHMCVCVSVTLLDHVESCHMCVCECYATGSCRKLSYVCV